MSLLRVVCVSACALSCVTSVGAGPATARTLQEYGQQSSDLSARRGPSTSPGCLPAALKDALSRVRAACGQAEVVSTHRPGARIAGSGHRSYHASCRAVDFNAPQGCAQKVLAGWPGGLGTYSGAMHHIHLDTGPRVRFAHGGGRSTAKTRLARQSTGRSRHAARGTRSYRYAAARGARKYRYAARSVRRHRHAASSARRLRAVRHVNAKVHYGKRSKWRARSFRRS